MTKIINIENNFTNDENTEIYGDLNNDKEVNEVDAEILKEYLLSNQTLNDLEKLKSDLNQDGRISEIDRQYILNYIQNKTPSGVAGQLIRKTLEIKDKLGIFFWIIIIFIIFYFVEKG